MCKTLNVVACRLIAFHCCQFEYSHGATRSLFVCVCVCVCVRACMCVFSVDSLTRMWGILLNFIDVILYSILSGVNRFKWSWMSFCVATVCYNRKWQVGEVFWGKFRAAPIDRFYLNVCLTKQHSKPKQKHKAKFWLFDVRPRRASVNVQRHIKTLFTASA